MDLNLQATLEFAGTLVSRVGATLVSLQNNAKITAYKDRQDIATSADLAAEQIYIEAISREYPDHSIFSEEAGDNHFKSDYKWLIDPLEGTKEYAKGLASFGTCITLLHQNQPILAAVYSPHHQELYSAAQGIGAFLNGQPIEPATNTSLENAFVYAYLPTYKETEADSLKHWQTLHKLSRKCYRVRSTPQETQAMCWVASGKTDAAIRLDAGSKQEDTLPGMFIAKTAGAVVSDISGNPIKNNSFNHGFIVSTKGIHHDLVQILS